MQQVLGICITARVMEVTTDLLVGGKVSYLLPKCTHCNPFPALLSYKPLVISCPLNVGKVPLSARNGGLLVFPSLPLLPP